MTNRRVISTLAVCAVAAVGIVDGGGAVVDAAVEAVVEPGTRWESEIVGFPDDGDPFRFEPEGEITAIEVGTGPWFASLRFLATDGASSSYGLDRPGWPSATRELRPGERIISVFGNIESGHIESLGATTSHMRTFAPIGESVDPWPIGSWDPWAEAWDFELHAPAGHGVVGFTGSAVERVYFDDVEGYISAIGLITEPMATPPCEFRITNASTRTTTVVAWVSADVAEGVEEYELGILAAGETATFATPPGFVPEAPALGAVALVYVNPDGTTEQTFWTSETAPCGSDLTFDPADVGSNVDAARPSAPGGFSATASPVVGAYEWADAVLILWEPAIDDVGVVGYQILRNGVEIGRTTTLGWIVRDPDPGPHWFQVRAFDAAGNMGAKTAPVRVDTVAAIDAPPSAPANLSATVDEAGDVTLSWEEPATGGSVTTYRVFRNGEVIGLTASTELVVAQPGVGSHWFQVRAHSITAESVKSAPVRVDVVGVDTRRPSAPFGLDPVVELSGDVSMAWGASFDDVGVVEYQVLRNGVEVGVTSDLHFVHVAPGVGSHWYQVLARDAVGNESVRSAPVRVDVVGVDVVSPSAPGGLGAVIEPSGDVTLGWDAATDDVGVVEYQVLRNGVEVGVTSDLHFVHMAPGVGSHWYQVRARDAAGNEGVKTAPVRVDII